MRYRYREEHEMKDSGVEWIGKIPKNWTVSRIDKEFKVRNEKVSDKEYQALSVTKQGILLQLENVAKSDNNDNRKKVCVGDFVINSRADRKGSCGVSPYDGSVSLICNVLTSKKLSPQYVHNLFRNYYFSEEFYRWGSGIVDDLWSTNIEKMKKINIPIPFEKEDEKIANFLDKKTSQFDLIISKKEELIQRLEEAKKSLISEVVTGKVKVIKTYDGYELVKRNSEEMKDSGVEWIGHIPRNFKTVRLGLISFVTKLAGFEYTDYMAEALSSVGEVPIVRAGNIKMNKFINQEKEFIDMETSKKLNRCALYQKCVLITFIGAGIGEVALFNKYKRHHLAPNVAKIEILGKNKKIIDEQYLVYYLMSSSGQEEVNKIKKASAQPSLSMETIRSMKIVIPELNEQYEINEYLNFKIKKIDKIIINIKSQIQKLKEAKQSLISEAVTGKIEILD